MREESARSGGGDCAPWNQPLDFPVFSAITESRSATCPEPLASREASPLGGNADGNRRTGAPKGPPYLRNPSDLKPRRAAADWLPQGFSVPLLISCSLLPSSLPAHGLRCGFTCPERIDVTSAHASPRKAASLERRTFQNLRFTLIHLRSE